MIPHPSAAATFAAVFVGLYVAHSVADHWVQTSHQSQHKGERGWPGRWACFKHVASYTATTFVAVVVLAAVLDLPITGDGIVGGQLVSAVTHYWADRRFTLAWLARIARKSEFYKLGAPREGHDDAPHIGTGSYALDQSWHHLWLLIAALVTTAV